MIYVLVASFPGSHAKKPGNEATMLDEKGLEKHAFMSNVMAVFRLISGLMCNLCTHADINQAHGKDIPLENLPKNLRRYV